MVDITARWPRPAALATLLFLTACGGAATHEPTTPEPARAATAMDFAPTDTFAVAEIDVARLHASPYGTYTEQWFELFEQVSHSVQTEDAERNRRMWRGLTRVTLFVGPALPDGGGLHGGLGVDTSRLTPIGGASGKPDEVDPASAGAPPPPEESVEGPVEPPRHRAPDVQVVGVIEGTFQGSDLHDAIAQIAATDDSDLHATQVGDHQVFASSDGSSVLFVVNDSMVVISANTDSERLLAIAEDPSGAAPIPEALRALTTSAGAQGHAFDLTLGPTDELREMLRQAASRGSEHPALDAAVVDTLEGLTLHVDVADGLDAAARVHTNNVLTAAALTQELNNRIDEARGQPAVAMMGFGDALAALRARVDGTDCLVSAQLDDAAFRALLDRVTGLVRLGAALAASAPQPSEQPGDAPVQAPTEPAPPGAGTY